MLNERLRDGTKMAHITQIEILLVRYVDNIEIPLGSCLDQIETPLLSYSDYHIFTRQESLFRLLRGQKARRITHKLT